MQFDDVKLLPGATIQLQTSSGVGQPERFNSRYVGAVAGRCLLFSVPRAGGKAIRFRPGQKIAARIMVANGIGLFACVVESQTTEPYPLLCVSYPDTVKFKGIRGATRVALDLPAHIENRSALSAEKIQGRVADISTSGARVELKKAIADVGDNVVIEATVSVAGLIRRLTIDAIIRSRVERSTQEQTQDFPAVYGVEFTEQNEDELLILYAYVYSQILAEQTPEDSE